MSKFMKLKRTEPNYIVISKTDNERLGKISFHVTWKKWIFEPEVGTYYDAQCLADLIVWLKDIENDKLKGDIKI